MKAIGVEAARQAFEIEAQCLMEAFAHIDEAEFGKAVDVLSAAPRIAASGATRCFRPFLRTARP